jgi:hypothetical protein
MMAIHALVQEQTPVETGLGAPSRPGIQRDISGATDQRALPEPEPQFGIKLSQLLNEIGPFLVRLLVQ